MKGAKLRSSGEGRPEDVLKKRDEKIRRKRGRNRNELLVPR